jgi:putative DNA primase/helicase
MVDTVNSVFGRAKRNAPGTPPGGESGASGGGGEFPWSDLGNGRRLVQVHGERLRHVHAWKRWLFWDGSRWYVSEGDEVIRLMNEVLEGMMVEVAAITNEEQRDRFRAFVVRSQGINARRNALASASNESEVVVGVDELDADPWLLNCRNGTLDLRTKELLAHDPRRNITKIIPVEWDPKAKCPTFGAFLKRAFPDPEMLKWVQRIIGYALTGSVREKGYFTLLGETDTGKTVLILVMTALLGPDYSQQLKPNELLVKKLEGGNNDGLADLKGKRMAFLSEPAQGSRLDVAAIKHITGGGRIRASRKYEHAFEYQPEATIFIDTNHELIISDTDDSIWNRTNIIPFKVQIPKVEQDPDLAAKLELELPGILRWAVEGCLAWQEVGLDPPEAARAAEKEYRDDQDPLRDFIVEKCELGPNSSVWAKALQSAYADWCEENRIRYPLTPQQFGIALRARGCHKGSKTVEGKKSRTWVGIGLFGQIGPS